jgi:asparagine synthase (glutamine-hydrolysing)
MLHSLEVRTPFLARELLEFGFGRLPDRLRVTPYTRKVLLRRLARRLLPDSFDVGRKQGFSLPLNTWFKGDWSEFTSDVLMAADQAIFNRDAITGLLQGQIRGLSNASRLFCLVMFELWRREYHVTL